MHRVKNNAHICTDKNDTSFALDKYQKLLIIPPTSEKCLAPCNQLDINIRGESFKMVTARQGTKYKDKSKFFLNKIFYFF